ncbi:hypothetical protein HHL17_28210 [Chitinophaga sp. G-6-1-13]|uniref:Lipoprotein n=1 Tax=Chitinophaga fulva TaxID=2728842 RepID=A0A848GUF4_9BACT|nr:hypothetical protein [Chitinophaga fulva]NML41111.1 hypothetical protein [Chitinophaga fulva]
MYNKLLLSLSVILIFTGCFSKETNAKREKAKKDAEYIVNNLDKPAVTKHLPEKHFSAE